MLFCRYQEFYESPFLEIKDQAFDLLNFMRIYKNSKEARTFTYPDDWSGYNIPGEKVLQCLDNVFKHPNLCGVNVYDHLMAEIVYFITKSKKWSEKTERFYILGVDSLESNTMDHELAHGLFYTEPEYKEKTILLYNQLDDSVKNVLKSFLLNMGYCDEMVIDEVQAYMSTGLTKGMLSQLGFDDSEALRVQKPFNQLFNTYKNF
jgi:hypothetical protein